MRARKCERNERDLERERESKRERESERERASEGERNCTLNTKPTCSNSRVLRTNKLKLSEDIHIDKRHYKESKRVAAVNHKEPLPARSVFGRLQAMPTSLGLAPLLFSASRFLPAAMASVDAKVAHVAGGSAGFHRFLAVLGASGTPSLSRSGATDTSGAVAQSCAALLPGSRSHASTMDCATLSLLRPLLPAGCLTA
eukprot:3095670-Pleurochrysis_carterae.AAC.3